MPRIFKLSTDKSFEIIAFAFVLVYHLSYTKFVALLDRLLQDVFLLPPHAMDRALFHYLMIRVMASPSGRSEY